ncbi:hypothetical protein [Enterobacter asburiae]|nr:hypothetical protein [Enterobacter asburiae]WKE08134.1 hypothetical protein QOM24_18975 [Enterobacter asburiae]
MGYLLDYGQQKGRPEATLLDGKNVRNNGLFNIRVLTRTDENGLD